MSRGSSVVAELLVRLYCSYLTSTGKWIRLTTMFLI